MGAQHIYDAREQTGIFVEKLIKEKINKYAFGLVIWYDWWVTPAQLIAADGTPVVQPVIQVTVGCKGMILGPEGYCWTFCMLDMIPQEHLADKAIMEAVQNLRTMRMQQGSVLNGGGNPVPDNPQA